MAASDQFKKLMDTPMSRKQFLRYLGVILLSMLGVGNAISAILRGHHKATSPVEPTLKRSGFGGGKYGA